MTLLIVSSWSIIGPLGGVWYCLKKAFMILKVKKGYLQGKKKVCNIIRGSLLYKKNESKEVLPAEARKIYFWLLLLVVIKHNGTKMLLVFF